MTETMKPYNPLEKKSLANSIVARLLTQPPQVLDAAPFSGAGIYVIYYTGNFPLYEPISSANKSELRHPIYVGQAIPKGSSRGAGGLDTVHGKELSKRLAEHAKSISETHLKLDDFRCRSLAVDEVFISLGETMLISHYQPVWNVVTVGFGNHPPGGGRKDALRPYWDILHPGRAWAAKLRASKSRHELEEMVRNHFAQFPIPVPPLQF